MASADLLAASSMLGKVLYVGTLGTSSGDLLAPATNHAQIVKKATVCNTTASPATLTITVTQSGGATKTVISVMSLGAGETVDLTELAGLMLGPGDKLSALSGTASALDAVISGTENS